MLARQDHHDTVWREVRELAPDVVLDVQPLRRRIKMICFPMRAVVEDEVARAGSANNHLLQVLVRMVSAHDMRGRPPNVVYALNLKGEVGPFFKRDKRTVMVAVDGECQQISYHIKRPFKINFIVGIKTPLALAKAIVSHTERFWEIVSSAWRYTT